MTRQAQDAGIEPVFGQIESILKKNIWRKPGLLGKSKEQGDQFTEQNIALPTVSKHIGVLCHANIIRVHGNL